MNMNRANRPCPTWWRNLFPIDSAATDAILMNIDPAKIEQGHLCQATQRGEKLKVKLILSKDPLDCSFWGEPLFFAMAKDDLDMVGILLSGGAHPDGLQLWNGHKHKDDSWGVWRHWRTPLHYAFEKDMIEVAQLLLSNGADMEARCFYGFTPLHRVTTLFYRATRGRLLDMIKLLISNGANVNVKDSCGGTPLMVVATSAPVGVAAYLVDNGADLNATDNWGMTPLMYAAEAGYIDMCDFFIAQGAPLEVMDIHGMTAADYYALNNNGNMT